jgi:putative restriction endonuclease
LQFSKPQLLDLVLQGVHDSGAIPSVLDANHPFVVNIQHPQHPPTLFRIFIWNCTPGGANRAHDEFRVQVTTAPYIDPAMPTLMLGWHDDTGTFAAWDINAHHGQLSQSPSAQIKAVTLLQARDRGFAPQVKSNENVVAFRPDFFADYAFGSGNLHALGTDQNAIQLLDDMEHVSDYQIAAVANPGRRQVIRTITTHYRCSRFRGAVLDAYGHSCAFCALQLALIDAAHIVPVAAPRSEDTVINGIALCKLHHFAYDAGLLSFNEGFEIQISGGRLERLHRAGKMNRFPEFQAGLLTHVALPANAADYPPTELITYSRVVRGWLP